MLQTILSSPPGPHFPPELPKPKINPKKGGGEGRFLSIVITIKYLSLLEIPSQLQDTYQEGNNSIYNITD